MGQTIADLKRLQLASPVGKKKASKRKPSTPGSQGGRNVRWKNSHLYRCVREARAGYAFGSESAIDATYRSKALDEGQLWIFQHQDASVKRGEITPRYEAVYRVSQGGDHRWVLAQKCHLAQMYTRAQRTASEAMWSMLADGSPYWVDRYLFRKLKQKSAKKRYELKLK